MGAKYELNGSSNTPPSCPHGEKYAVCATKTTHWTRADKKGHKLFDLFLHGGHSFSLRALEFVRGAAEVTQHIMALVVQEDVLHLSGHKR